MSMSPQPILQGEGIRVAEGSAQVSAIRISHTAGCGKIEPGPDNTAATKAV